MGRETPSLYSSLALLQLTNTSQKRDDTPSGALSFARVTQGTSPDILVWKPTGFMIVAPWDYKYLHTLKAVA